MGLMCIRWRSVDGNLGIENMSFSVELYDDDL